MYLSSPDPETGWGTGTIGGGGGGGTAAAPLMTIAGPASQDPAPAGDRRGSLVLHLGADDNDTTGETATRLVHVRIQPIPTTLDCHRDLHRHEISESRWLWFQVEPIAGRMIIFDARTVLHEVLPHDRPADRLALTVPTPRNFA